MVDHELMRRLSFDRELIENVTSLGVLDGLNYWIMKTNPLNDLEYLVDFFGVNHNVQYALSDMVTRVEYVFNDIGEACMTRVSVPKSIKRDKVIDCFSKNRDFLLDGFKSNKLFVACE